MLSALVGYNQSQNDKEYDTVNTYITGATIKSLREAKGMTQTELAERIGVTGKAVSKWRKKYGLDINGNHV